MRRVLAAAFAFGLGAAAIKGGGGDAVRSALGNLSAPWLLVAFYAGTRVPRSALAGVAATLSALAGFYIMGSLLIGEDLGVELRANRGYFEAGVLSGPVFGALGGWWRTRRSVQASVVAGALMVGEPLVLGLLGLATHGVGDGGPLVVRMLGGWGLNTSGPSLAVYGLELALGAALLVRARSAA